MEACLRTRSYIGFFAGAGNGVTRGVRIGPLLQCGRSRTEFCAHARVFRLWFYRTATVTPFWLVLFPTARETSAAALPAMPEGSLTFTCRTPAVPGAKP